MIQFWKYMEFPISRKHWFWSIGNQWNSWIQQLDSCESQKTSQNVTIYALKDCFSENVGIHRFPNIAKTLVLIDRDSMNSMVPTEKSWISGWWNIAKSIRGVAKYDTILGIHGIPNIAKTLVLIDRKSMESMNPTTEFVWKSENLPKRYHLCFKRLLFGWGWNKISV